MPDFSAYSLFDYLELIGVVLAVLDFADVTRRLETAIDRATDKIPRLLSLGFLYTAGEDKIIIQETHVTGVTLDPETGNVSPYGETHHVPTKYVVFDPLLAANYVIQGWSLSFRDRIKPILGTVPSNLIRYCFIVIAYLLYTISTMALVFVLICIIPIWLLLVFIDAFPKGTVGTISFVVALYAFFFNPFRQ